MSLRYLPSMARYPITMRSLLRERFAVLRERFGGSIVAKVFPQHCKPLSYRTPHHQSRSDTYHVTALDQYCCHHQSTCLRRVFVRTTMTTASIGGIDCRPTRSRTSCSLRVFGVQDVRRRVYDQLIFNSAIQVEPRLQMHVVSK